MNLGARRNCQRPGIRLTRTLFPRTALATTGTTYAFPAATTNSYGWAIQGGIQLKMDQLNVDYLRGDNLWVQAAYEQGAFKYVYGDNLATSYGAVNGNRYYGSGYTPANTAAGWNPNVGSDCVFTLSGVCERQTGGASRPPTSITGCRPWPQPFNGSDIEINYSNNALAGYGARSASPISRRAARGAQPCLDADQGLRHLRRVHVRQRHETRPAGLAPDAVLKSVGLPGYKASENEYEGRVRVQRAF